VGEALFAKGCGTISLLFPAAAPDQDPTQESANLLWCVDQSTIGGERPALTKKNSADMWVRVVQV
jgi:hypothetical protein